MAKGDNLEKVTLQIFQGGGYDDPEQLRLSYLQGDAFVITFLLNSQLSFDSSMKLVHTIKKTKKIYCPMVLVGMQKSSGQLAVNPKEAADRAAKLGVKHFHVQSQKHDQVTGPFEYLAQCHIQARGKPFGQSWARLWTCQRLCKAYYWLRACFTRQQFNMERLEDTNAGETIISSLGEPPMYSHQRKSFASDFWPTILIKDGYTYGYTFHYNEIKGQHFYALELPEDQSLLKQLRRRIPWSVLYPPDQCSSEEFLYLAQSWSPQHPHKTGSPALWDIFRAIFKNELHHTISNLTTHHGQCQKCREFQCPELYRLMFMLLQDQIGSQIRVQLDDQNHVSATGTVILDFRLTKVRLWKSSVLLDFENQTSERIFRIEFDKLWRLTTFGIYMAHIPREVGDFLPLWIQDPPETQLPGTRA